jgi:hypothetical protein
VAHLQPVFSAFIQKIISPHSIPYPLILELSAFA